MPLHATRPCRDKVGALDRPGCFEGTFEIGVAEAAEDGAQLVEEAGSVFVGFRRGNCLSRRARRSAAMDNATIKKKTRKAGKA
jgi:hypothetical protein